MPRIGQDTSGAYVLIAEEQPELLGNGVFWAKPTEDGVGLAVLIDDEWVAVTGGEAVEPQPQPEHAVFIGPQSGSALPTWRALTVADLPAAVVLKNSPGNWFPNSYFALLGETAADISMTGMYDRNELANAALRGTVTVTINGAGTPGAATAEYNNKLFAGAPGDYYTIVGVDATTISIVVHVDLQSAQPNYNRAQWQPVVQLRTVGDVYPYPKKITVEVSDDNSNWYKPGSGAWETTNMAAAALSYSYWFGTEAYPGIVSWRYVRFTLEDWQVTPGYSTVWISQLALRHLAAPWSRHYLKTAGDTMYGDLTLVDGKNIVAGSSSGLKIGTATSQKLGFYNATPVAQQSIAAAASDLATAITLANDLRSKLRTLGLLS